IPNWEWRHKCRWYSSWKLTRNTFTVGPRVPVSLPFTLHERSHQRPENGRQELVRRPPEDGRDRLAYLADFLRRDRKRRRHLEHVRLVLAVAHEDRERRVPQQVHDVDRAGLLAEPAPRPAGRVQFDADQQPEGAHLAHRLALGQPLGQELR